MATLNDRQLEIAWAAGFFDGEGHTRVSKRSTYRLKDGTHRTYNHNVSPVVQMSQTDKVLLVRFRKAMGGRGTISGPFQHKANNPLWSEFWCYRCWKLEDSIEVMEMLMPFLSQPKKGQWRKTLAEVRRARRNWSVTDVAPV